MTNATRHFVMQDPFPVAAFPDSLVFSCFLKILLFNYHFVCYNKCVKILHFGALAQLGARLNGIQKATGSSPVCSMNQKTIADTEFLVFARVFAFLYNLKKYLLRHKNTYKITKCNTKCNTKNRWRHWISSAARFLFLVDLSPDIVYILLNDFAVGL